MGFSKNFRLAAAPGYRVERRRRVLIDSSAVMACVEDGCDFYGSLGEVLEGEVELLVPHPVLEELRRLAGGRGRRGRLARLALALLLGGGPEWVAVRVVKAEGASVDEAILRLAAEQGACILTADRELASRARALGLPTLTYVKSRRAFA